jgi:uncharacterized protein (TIGR02246 family)
MMAMALPLMAGERRMLAAEDRKGVETTLDGMIETWNRHDMDGFAALLSEDCEWVNVVGAYWPTKAAIMKALRVYHATMFKDVGQHETRRSVSEIAPGVAIGVVTFTMDDYKTPDGRVMQGVTNRLTYIMVKQDGRWLVRSGHNTTIDPVAVAHDPNHQR